MPTLQVKKQAVFGKKFEYVKENTYSCGEQRHTVNEHLHKRTGMEFVEIPAGTFEMGDENGEEDEKPLHEVKLSGFLLAKTVVTQGLWKSVMGTAPWKEEMYIREGDDYPATCMSWKDCRKFCKKTGLKLPTEAQWEYAACAGANTEYYWGESMDGDYAWYEGNAWDVGEKYPHRVGQKKSNAYGLYDMAGNVWEWCADWYGDYYYRHSPTENPKGPSKGTSRVARGGGFYGSSRGCRLAYRNSYFPNYYNDYLGFRPAKPSKSSPSMFFQTPLVLH